jgi:enoyl-CoA hydratase
MADYRYVTYETLDEGTIARIMLNRPNQRNAQQRGLLVELNEAFLEAEADDNVRVVILGGNGPMFSSGHDWFQGMMARHAWLRISIPASGRTVRPARAQRS